MAISYAKYKKANFKNEIIFKNITSIFIYAVNIFYFIWVINLDITNQINTN